MKLTMQLRRGQCDIIIKKGSLARAGQLANFARKVLVVTDEGVPARYGKTLLQQCGEGRLLVLKQGEEHKDTGAWRTVLQALMEHEFGPWDAVAAVGGGVVGDVAGFAAATYLGGIPWFQLPTTTMAQLDAAVGGRAWLNLQKGANVARVCHPPALVAADTSLLKTLPQRHYTAGMAAALGLGLVACSELFTLLEAGDMPGEVEMENVVYLAARCKKGMLEQLDYCEREPLLDYGQPLAAALLAAASGQLLYGESVALGMLPLIESPSLLRRTRAVMRKLGLPLKLPVATDEVLAQLADEPAQKGGLPVVRVKTLGQGYAERIEAEELRLLTEAAFPAASRG